VSANRAVFLGAIPVVLLLAFGAWSLITFANGGRIEQGWVVHTYRVMDSLRAILNDATDAETGQRGYLLTRRASYLAPFHASKARLGGDLETFETLTQDNPSQQARAHALREILEKRIAVLDAAIDGGVAAPPLASPGLLALLDQGKAMMDTARALIGLGLDEEKRLLEERVEARRAVEQKEIVSAIMLTVLALVILFGAALLLVRNQVRLAESEAIRARQARILQTTLDNIRDGVVVFDHADKVAAFNQIFFRLMDFPETLAAVGTALDSFRDIDAKAGRPNLDDAPQAINDAAAYARFRRAERELDVYRAEVPAEGFLIAAADVTARVRAENAVRQAQKMEAVGHLTGGVAHDFNNLLQIISANLDLAVAHARGDAKTAERLQAAIGAVERGSRLTAQLLAFARRQALEPRSVHPGRLVQEMTDLLRRTLGERYEVECIVAGGLWNTLVDANQLQNAILNLAINAKDAMPDGGKLTIEIANAYLDDAYAAQHAEVGPGQYVMVAVSDTGTGMTPDVVARAFDPFFTTKPEGKGTGLGLSQVYGFVKQSNGHVKIYSEPGHGTTMKIYLPRSKKPTDVDHVAYVAPVEGGSETVLVVEDDDGVRAAVADMLGELGYGVATAGDAEQALAFLAKNPKVDLLFTDVVMPGPVGSRELARRAKDLAAGIKVLFTSGYTQNAIVHNGKLDDDVVLLSKPYRKDELARKLRQMLKPASAVADAAPAPSRPKIKVLIVDDEALIRATTIDMLGEIGVAHVEAADAAQALKILADDAAIDVLLTDLSLPGMKGGALIVEARKLKPGLAVIVASGYSTETAPLQDDRTVFLPKPFDLAQLKDALAKV
jgi:signal transduction histidine kinase/DNA-binding response OmpR family regulator